MGVKSIMFDTNDAQSADRGHTQRRQCVIAEALK